MRSRGVRRPSACADTPAADPRDRAAPNYFGADGRHAEGARRAWRTGAFDAEVERSCRRLRGALRSRTAYEGLGELPRAREKYRLLGSHFADDPLVRGAHVREASIDAYLEDWKALGELGEALVSRQDGDDVDRMLGFGARALRKIQDKDDVGALRDANAGLEIMETKHYGSTGRLPVPAAQLRFALAEVRRTKSEKIVLQPVTDDFLLKMEMRCQGLLDAQSAYADAIRSTDPIWAKMSGVRVGEMYRKLHVELMAIPPDRAKSESDRNLFYAIMHVRYRVLVEKGMEMMTRTIDFAKKTEDESTWVTRARDAKNQMQASLDDEKAILATLPYTEAEVERTLEMMKERVLAKAQGKPVPPLKLPKK